MITQSYDINEFIQEIQWKDYSDIIHLADKEALEASGGIPGKERLGVIHKISSDTRTPKKPY